MENKLNLDPQTILDKEFHVDFKGYSPAEVDEFLDSVIQDYQIYERKIGELGEKLMAQERANASLKARIIELESRQKVMEEAGQNSFNQVDILKRLSRLEQEVYKNKQMDWSSIRAIAGLTKARGKSMLAQSAMIVVFAPAQSIRPGSRKADG